MMWGNPYAQIIQLVRGESSEQTRTGESQSVGLGASPCKMRLGVVRQKVPLTVTVAGVEQPTQALKINERLTRGAEWKVQVTSPGSDYKGLSGSLAWPVTCPGGHGAPVLGQATGGQIHSTDTIIGKDTPSEMATVKQLEVDLDVGDQVLLLTEDDQIFYILMKVVDAV